MSTVNYHDYLLRKSTQIFSLRNEILPQGKITGNLALYLNKELANVRKQNKSLNIKETQKKITKKAEEFNKKFKISLKMNEKIGGKINYLTDKKEEINYNKNIIQKILLKRYKFISNERVKDDFYVESEGIPAKKGQIKEKPTLERQLKYCLHESISEKELEKYFQKFNYLKIKKNMENERIINFNSEKNITNKRISKRKIKSNNDNLIVQQLCSESNLKYSDILGINLGIIFFSLN